MENASKALIIAGAILLAILLISLGIMIFNQAQDTVNNSGMSQAEITAFNAIDMSSIEKEKTYTVTAGYCTDPSATRSDAPNTLTKGCIYTMRIEEE